jgi:hypothetical protein
LVRYGACVWHNYWVLRQRHGSCSMYLLGDLRTCHSLGNCICRQVCAHWCLHLPPQPQEEVSRNLVNTLGSGPSHRTDHQCTVFAPASVRSQTSNRGSGYGGSDNLQLDGKYARTSAPSHASTGTTPRCSTSVPALRQCQSHGTDRHRKQPIILTCTDVLPTTQSVMLSFMRSAGTYCVG